MKTSGEVTRKLAAILAADVVAYPVGPDVGNVKNDNAALIEPMAIA
jgi:hypothetical protein